ncbi:MAG: Ig-like domain-containing protein [bacterium]
MFTFKTKVITSAVVFLVVASLGITAFSNYEKVKPLDKLTTITQSQPDSSQKSSSDCAIVSSCQQSSANLPPASDLNVVSSTSSSTSNNSAVLANTNTTTIKGIISNMEISHKGKSFVLSGKESSMLQLQFNSQQALELAKKYDKTFVQLSGFYNDSYFAVDSVSPDKFDSQINQIQTQAFTGQTKFATILCKFSDIATEGQAPSWFQNRLEGAGIDSSKTYWNEISDGSVNISGGQVLGWFTLPHPRSYYTSPNVNTDRLFNDCTETADSSIYFPSYTGINLYFNSTIDNFAAGLGTVGRWYQYLDFTFKDYGITWLGNDGWSNSDVVQHELGHTAGLPHSSSLQAEYGSYWDLMSSGYGYQSGITGALPTGPIAYYKWRMGLVQDSQVATVDIATNTTYKLNQVNQPTPAVDTKQVLIIPVSQNQFFTVESRKKNGYDKFIPEAGVLIHNIDLTRNNWAYVEDIQKDNDVNNSGSVLRLNESYVNTVNHFMVKVVGDYGTGYQVQVLSTNPVVTITSPSSRLLAGANYSLTATAADSNGTISKVEFYKSGVLVVTDTTAPYQTDLTNMAAGDYLFTAKAYDNDNTIATSIGVLVTVATTNNFSTNINGINIEYTHTTGQLRFYGSFTDMTSCGRAINVNQFTDGLNQVLQLQRSPNFNSNSCGQKIYKYEFDKTRPLQLNYSELLNFGTTFKFREEYFIG